MEPFIGQISVVGFNYAPRGWALCNGQLLSIAQNQALFSILGTAFGGDGISTFGLPDLRGRAAMHVGNANPIGSSAGQEGVALNLAQMPVHTHAVVNGVNVAPSQSNPVGNMWSNTTTATGLNYAKPPANDSMGGNALQNTGNGLAHDNMHPSLVLNFIIALNGVYPSRS